MLGKRKLIVDSFSEVERMLAPYTDELFYDLAQHVIVPGAVYVIGREQFKVHGTVLRELIESQTIYAVYSNPCEGSEPMAWNFTTTGILDLVEQRQIGIIAGGSLPEAWGALVYENFLPQINDYTENTAAAQKYALLSKPNRPYKFLFLNGRMRDHRKYMLLRLQQLGLLTSALWTNLDSSIGVGAPLKDSGLLMLDGEPLVRRSFPAHYLPREYEVDRYRDRTQLPAVITHRLEAKTHLFDNEWGEIYLTPEPYLATAFSLVSETVFSYPYSFRTEKIWKPVAIGHPFIVASNRGYYKDLHDLGFKTFGHLIDETWDSIDNNQLRMERIVATVQDLCSQDLDSFLRAAADTCKYNQLLLDERQRQIRSSFPQQFLEYTNERFRL